MGFQGLEFKQPRSGSSTPPFKPGPLHHEIFFEKCAMLSTMRGRGCLPAAQKPYTLTPKPPRRAWHDPKDRARLSHVARGHALVPPADTRCALVFQNIHRFQSAPIKSESAFKSPPIKNHFERGIPVAVPVTPARDHGEEQVGEERKGMRMGIPLPL